MKLFAALVGALLLTATLLPGTNWTLAPLDPALAAGGYALIGVGRGAAGAVADQARAAGATNVAALDAIGVVTAQVPAQAVRALRSDPHVAFIAADAVVSATAEREHFEKGKAAPSPGVEVIGANAAWSTATGRGVTVALMDTGIAEHPDLAGSVVARLDFVKDDTEALDPSGHGTFVAGLIAAHGATFKGVAPDAKLVSLRVLDKNGRGTMHSVLAAFDWLLHNRATQHIQVLNLSFGAPQTASYQRTLLAGVVESAWFAGITVIAAAGNAGPTPGTVVMPGADPFVVTVGSFADQGTVDGADDRESVFSSRGPTADGFVKPELLAPGEHIVSLRVPGTAMDKGAPREDPSDTSQGLYGRLSGTSASSAMAAGAAALVLEAHRSYRPTDVKGALVAGGRRIAGTQTIGLDAAKPLTARSDEEHRVNARLRPSRVLLTLLANSANNNGNFNGSGVSWEGVSWEGISWESVSWEGITWEGVNWESISWETVAWESLP